MTKILNEKRINQLINKIDKSLFGNGFGNGGILSCTFKGHDDIVAIRGVLITFQTLVRYGIVEFVDDDNTDGFVFKNIDIEKYEFDDKGFMKLPEVPEVEQ